MLEDLKKTAKTAGKFVEFAGKFQGKKAEKMLRKYVG